MADLRYSFDDLVQNLEGRRRLGEEPPVLLLGAGASAAAGLATMQRLYEAEGIAADAPDAFERFCARMARRDDRERFRFLAAMLQTADPHQVTPGYRALARLCAQHVFDIVLSANLDPLLEDAFSETALKRRDVLVLVNGVLRRDRLPLLLMDGVPRVKLVKLHGDLFHRYMAWTPGEMAAYLRDITPALKRALAMRDVLVAGYSMRDPAVRALALATGGTVWYAGPSEPPADVAALLARAKVRLLIEERCRFESFFPALASALGIAADPAPAAAAATPATPETTSRGGAARMPRGVPAPPAAAARPRAQRPTAAPPAPAPPPETADNLDDVLAATLGIARVPGGPLAATGFLLAEPRVIVTDGWVAQPLGDTIEVATQAGERHRCRVLARLARHPFGPALLEAPPALHVAGLRLDAAPVRRGLPVHAAVGTNLRRFLMEGGMPVDQAVAEGMIDEATGRSIEAALKKRAAAKGSAAAAAHWQRFSLSSGRVKALLSKPVPVDPLGDVPELIEIEMATDAGQQRRPGGRRRLRAARLHRRGQHGSRTAGELHAGRAELGELAGRGAGGVAAEAGDTWQVPRIGHRGQHPCFPHRGQASSRSALARRADPAHRRSSSPDRERMRHLPEASAGLCA